MFDPGGNSTQDSRITSAIAVAGGIVCALLLGTSIGESGLLPFALFGAVAALLRIIPYIGSVVAGLLPVLLSLAVFNADTT